MTESHTSPPGDELLQHLAQYDLAVGELALGLRSVILEEAPGAFETVFRSYALAVWYSLSERFSDSFCYIGVSSRHVNLSFCRGVELADPDRLLEGSGKLYRHIKILSRDDLNQPHIRRFIRAAMRQVQSGRKEKESAARTGRSAKHTPTTKRRATSKRRVTPK
jgi:hypothetical protein